MDSVEVVAAAFGRVRDLVHDAVQDLSPGQLAYRVDSEANSIAWLVWHLARVQDDHVADAAQTEQVWMAAGWSERFQLPFDPTATGYGHSSDDVAAVRVRSGALLTDYLDTVHVETIAFLDRLSDQDLDRIIDEQWDPPVSLGVRLVSIVSDDLQHAGQAAFLRGLIERLPISG